MAKASRQLAKITRQKDGQAVASEKQAVGLRKKEKQRIPIGHKRVAVVAAEMLKPIKTQ